MKKVLNNASGVTLVELLIVIVIIGIIAAFAVPAFGRIIERSRVDADQANVMVLNRSTRLYLLSNPQSGVFSVENSENIDSDGLIDYLVSERYLDERVKPLAPDGEFSWNASMQSWLYNNEYIVSFLDGLEFGTTGGSSNWLKGTYTGTATDITIPRAIDGTTIEEIQQGVFRFGDGFSSTQLSSVSFAPDSEIEIIHNGAFKDNNLTEIQFPNSLEEIHFWAFHNNDIQELVFPNALTKIEGQAFAGNDNLTKITIGEGVTIGDNAFRGNNAFRDAYEVNGAGTYIWDGNTWVKD